MFVIGNKHQVLPVIVNPSTTWPLPGAALRAPDVGVVAVMLNPSSDALLLGVEEFDVPDPRALVVIDNPSAACALLGAALRAADTGVVDLVGAWLLLCAICALTRWPAASAPQRLSSPARTLAATILASRRAFSPGWVGWAPLTPSRSRQALCGSRTVPPPMVPTSIEGIETDI